MRGKFSFTINYSSDFGRKLGPIFYIKECISIEESFEKIFFNVSFN